MRGTEGDETGDGGLGVDPRGAGPEVAGARRVNLLQPAAQVAQGHRHAVVVIALHAEINN